MKTKMIAFLMVLLLIVLAGCNNTPSNEDKKNSTISLWTIMNTAL